MSVSGACRAPTRPRMCPQPEGAEIISPTSGTEPGPPAWRAATLTTTPHQALTKCSIKCLKSVFWAEILDLPKTQAKNHCRADDRHWAAQEYTHGILTLMQHKVSAMCIPMGICNNMEKSYLPRQGSFSGIFRAPGCPRLDIR